MGMTTPWNSGVAILWQKTLDRCVHKLHNISNDRLVAIQLRNLQRPICLLAVYLPSRSGGTDVFKDSLDYVHSVLEQLCFDNDVYILGDFNADPGSEGGPLATTSVNEQGHILLRYLKKWEYISTHLQPHSSIFHAASHTYVSEAHGSCSTIDHILAPRHLLPRFSECMVWEEDPLNLSDRLPVSANIQCCLQAQTPVIKPSICNKRDYKPNWRKLDEEGINSTYTLEVEQRLNAFRIPDLQSLVNDPNIINSYVGQIMEVLITAAKQAIPPKRFIPHQKPGWDKHLKAAHNKSKLAHKQWIKAGRPRQSDHPARRQYKEAKSAFRACLRTRQREENEEFLEALYLHSGDSGKLFRQLRRARGQACDPTTFLTMGGCTYQGEDIPSAWASYFESLATPSNQDYDESFRQLINAEYESLLDLSVDDFTPLTEEEVDEAVQSLKLGKAAGPDGIEPEHLFS